MQFLLVAATRSESTYGEREMEDVAVRLQKLTVDTNTICSV
jgi:hypothetical protein